MPWPSSSILFDMEDNDTSEGGGPGLDRENSQSA